MCSCVEQSFSLLIYLVYLQLLYERADMTFFFFYSDWRCLAQQSALMAAGAQLLRAQNDHRH